LKTAVRLNGVARESSANSVSGLGRDALIGVVVIVVGEPNLFEAVDALGAACSFASRLNCWQQQCDKYSNDCDDDEKFDKRECASDLAQTSVSEVSPKRRILTPLIITTTICKQNSPTSFQRQRFIQFVARSRKFATVGAKRLNQPRDLNVVQFLRSFHVPRR
jgi:hypothetical protein